MGEEKKKKLGGGIWEHEYVCVSLCVRVCVCVCDREGDKCNKMEKRLTTLSGLPQCFPATCQLNHQETGDTCESRSCNQTPLSPSLPPSVLPSTLFILNSASPSGAAPQEFKERQNGGS